MNGKEAMNLFESMFQNLVVGGYCKYKNGILICPLDKNTHDILLGVYYYFDEDHKNGVTVSIPAKVFVGIEWEKVNESSLSELTRLAVEACSTEKSQAERIRYIIEHASKHLKEYIKTNAGYGDLLRLA